MIDIEALVDEMTSPQPHHVSREMLAGASHERLRQALRTCLGACERLSVEEEEGRSLRPAFCLLDAAHNAAAVSLAGYTPFDAPLQFDDPGLAKIASAIDRLTSCFVVLTPDEGKPLVITGIANYPRRWGSTALGIWIDALGPARIRAKWADGIMVADPDGLSRELSPDQMEALIPHSWAEDIVGYLSMPVEGMNVLPIGPHGERIDPATLSPHIGDLQATIRTKAPLFLARALRELAASAERLGCGATLIIGPHAPDRQYVDEGVSLATGGGSGMTLDRWWGSSLLDALAYSSLETFFEQGMTLTAEPIADLDGLVEKYKRASVRAFLAWEEDAERVTRLAAKDGAAFLTSKLRCVAFGASIGPKTPIPLSGETEEFLKNRGERHGSVARAVSQHGSDTLGLCLSHDGGFTIFMVSGDQVTHVRHVTQIETRRPT